MLGRVLQADVRIGSPSEGATRGVIAERRFCPNEVLLSLPQHLTIPFEGTPEEAVVLLLYIKHQKALSKRFQPWLDALPGPDDFIAWDCLDDEALTLLQCRGMVRQLRPNLHSTCSRSTDHEFMIASWNECIAIP